MEDLSSGSWKVRQGQGHRPGGCSCSQLRLRRVRLPQPCSFRALRYSADVEGGGWVGRQRNRYPGSDGSTDIAEDQSGAGSVILEPTVAEMLCVPFNSSQVTPFIVSLSLSLSLSSLSVVLRLEPRAIPHLLSKEVPSSHLQPQLQFPQLFYAHLASPTLG